MNIEIANRLVELRKKNGYSQEELAEKLGLSRQAVSKWERAESSPDTDNLICLAKLYNVSLDELLNSDETIDEIAENVKEKKENNKVIISLCDDDEDDEDDIDDEDDKNIPKWEIIISSCIALVCLLVFLILGFSFEWGWRVGWVSFLLIPVIPSIFSSFRKKRFTEFLYPVFVTFIFLLVGMAFGIWHPTWIVFVTIPLFYSIFGPIDKMNKNEDKPKTKRIKIEKDE